MAKNITQELRWEAMRYARRITEIIMESSRKLDIPPDSLGLPWLEYLRIAHWMRKHAKTMKHQPLFEHCVILHNILVRLNETPT